MGAIVNRDKHQTIESAKEVEAKLDKRGVTRDKQVISY